MPLPNPSRYGEDKPAHIEHADPRARLKELANRIHKLPYRDLVEFATAVANVWSTGSAADALLAAADKVGGQV